MAIYTKKGDHGKTALFNGKKVWKSDVRVNAYGSIDELNSCLGMSRSYAGESGKKYQKYLCEIIIKIQNDLLLIGSSLADSDKEKVEDNLKSRVSFFEQKIDEMTKVLPKLSNFILLGGGELGASFHVARVVCRRAEREVVKLSKKEKIDGTILVYMNRLSDLLFTMARYANYHEKKKEIIWKK